MIKRNKIKVFENPIIKNVSKIITWFVLVFLVLFACLLIYNIITSKIYEIRGQKYEPEVALYTIISPSMEPNINVYDVVVTKKVKDFSTINAGDVITFISTSSLGDGLTVTHRVIDVVKTEDDIKFRTKGDNNQIADSSLASSKNVMGKVLVKIPWVGHVQFLLQSKAGWLFALLVPAVLIVIHDVYKVIRLSSVKQKVSESIKEKGEDEELIEKKDKLKKELKVKYEKKKYDDIPYIKTDPPQKVEEVSENKDIDIKKAINKSKKIKKDIDLDDVRAKLAEINELEDNFKLPKSK